MTTQQEFRELIQNGENSFVSFGREGNEAIAQTIVAFANTAGGKIIMEEDPKLITSCLRNHVRLSIVPRYEEIVAEGRKVMVITVTQGALKPYACRFNKRETVYVRMGKRNEQITREQQKELFSSRPALPVEQYPVARTSLKNLDRDRIGYYLETVLGYDASMPEERIIETLQSFGFLEGSLCTRAGLLLFAKRPRLFLPSAGLRFISYAGKDRGARADGDTVLNNALVADRQMDDNRKTYTVARNGIFEDFILFATPFLSQESELLPETFRRERTWFYPEEAVREVLLNAFIHRDWTKNLEVTVENYTDRLEVTSPGRLQDSLTVEKLLAGRRSHVNPVIENVMRAYGYGKQGRGISQCVVPLMVQRNGVEPVIEATEDYVRVILYRKGVAV